MQRLDLTEGGATMRRRSTIRMGLAIAVVALAVAGLAQADHYPDVPAKVKRKDRDVINGLARMTYAEPYEMTLAGECGCLEPTCDGGFMISCGGEVDPYDAGFLNAVRRTSRETCLVCGCAVEAATLRATPVCLGF